MGNWGKLVTLLGVVTIVIGIILMSVGMGSMVAIPIIVGAVLLIIGLPRLVKGANPKIYGKIMRPTSRARAAWMWALFMFNLMPLILPDTLVLDLLDQNDMPPFPLAIIISGFPSYKHSGYGWLIPVFVSFFVLWIIGGILSGKYPGFVAAIFNTILALSFMFWFNFGVYMFIWSFYENVTLLTYPASLETLLYQYLAEGIPLYDDPEKHIYALIIVRLPLALCILLFGLLMVMRMFRQLTDTYSNIETKTLKMKNAVSFGVIISYIIALLPLYYSITFAIDNHPMAIPMMNYVVLIFAIILIIKAITAMLTAVRELSRQKIGEGKQGGLNFGMSTALFIVILIIAWLPIFLPLVDKGMNLKNHSVYNDNWNGWSEFRDVLEDPDGLNYTTYTLQSSLSAITRLDPNKQIILMVQGPNKFYNPAAEIPFFLKAFNTNFSMFICEDHGQGFTLLFEMFVASLGKTPFTLIPQGTLMDNSTGGYYKKPEFPIISDFGANSAEFTKNGVEKVVLSYATSFLGSINLLDFNVNMLDHLGWNVIGQTDGTFSYLDINGDRMWDQYNDKFSLDSSITGVLKQQEDPIMATLGGFLELGIPLKGTQAVFATKEIALNEQVFIGNSTGTRSSRVFVGTDASWLNNELISLEDPENPGERLFDNLQFALNIIEYLSCGRNKEDVIIVFDEAHIRSESGVMDFSSAGSFGFLHGYVNWLSTNPLISFLYPIMALRTLTNWIPKEQNKKKVQLSELIEAEKRKELLQFRTSSFFAKKINWYRVHKKYKQALSLLMRRIERKLHKLAGEGVNLSIDNIVKAIVASKGSFVSKETIQRIREFFTRMENLKNNKDIIKDEEDFQQMFLEMQWIANNI